MIRKEYKLESWLTFDDILKVANEVESRMPYIHCRVDIHRKVFEAVSKNGVILGGDIMAIHNICRILWDEKYKNISKASDNES